MSVRLVELAETALLTLQAKVTFVFDKYFLNPVFVTFILSKTELAFYLSPDFYPETGDTLMLLL